MIRRYFIMSLFLNILCINAIVAQFINLQIRIEPELSATVEQNLSFGQIIINSGVTEIALGDVNMGVFNVRAYHTQNIFIELEFPDALLHNNPSVSDEIPIDLNIAYSNNGRNNYEEAIPLINNQGFLPVFAPSRVGDNNRSDIWKEMFLYVYGSITVGAIQEGIYNGEILLLVEYD